MIALRIPSHFPVRATEWLLASVKATWGLVLLAPLDVFAANPSMAAMQQLAPQRVWGWIALIAGIVHLSALWVNGTRQRSPHFRATCSAIGGLFWFQVCLGLLESGVPNTGLAVYPWLFGFSIYNVVRAMIDARASDERAKGGKIGDRS